MIDTKRLYLRRFSKEDSLDLYEYLSLPDVTKFEPYDPLTMSEAIEAAKERSLDESFYAICHRDNDKVIGNIYLSKTAPDYIQTYTLGYVLNPKYQNKGYATEAVYAILDFVFRKKDAHRVIAYCNVKNTKSWELLERLKMRREGEMIQNIYFKYNDEGNPQWNDSYLYAILQTEFLQV